jgi:hypothetical protein
MTISLNPYVQTNAAGSFVIESDGLIIGTAYPDPATRYALAHGWLATTETLPMWGGVAISESIPSHAVSTNPRDELGSVIARSTALANITGFSVYDQDYAMVNTPQSPVPLADLGGHVNFFRVGCGQRVALEIDPTLVSLEGGLITQAVTWDFTNQKIIAGAGPFPGKILMIKVGNSMAAVRNATTGFVSWNRGAAAAVVLLQ